MRKTALISTLSIVPSCVALAFTATATIAAEEPKTDTIGPWEIEATFKGEKFDRCSITRKLDDDIVATFVKTGDALTLELSSPNWKLDRGKSYPVKMTLGPKSFDEEVAAEASSVSMDIKDEKFTAALRSASALNVVGAGATIHVPLDRSSDAFDRLDQCVTKNERAVETNPFCGAGTAAVTAGVPEDDGCTEIKQANVTKSNAMAEAVEDSKPATASKASVAKPARPVKSRYARSHPRRSWFGRADLLTVFGR